MARRMKFYSVLPMERNAISFTPRCDIDETDTHYLMTFDLPGVKKEDVKIELKDNQLIGAAGLLATWTQVCVQMSVVLESTFLMTR